MKIEKSVFLKTSPRKAELGEFEIYTEDDVRPGYFSRQRLSNDSEAIFRVIYFDDKWEDSSLEQEILTAVRARPLQPDIHTWDQIYPAEEWRKLS